MIVVCVGCGAVCRVACLARVSPAVAPLPRHLYGEAVRSDSGCATLENGGHLYDLAVAVRSEDAPLLQRRAALWGIVRLQTPGNLSCVCVLRVMCVCLCLLLLGVVLVWLCSCGLGCMPIMWAAVSCDRERVCPFSVVGLCVACVAFYFCVVPQLCDARTHATDHLTCDCVLAYRATREVKTVGLRCFSVFARACCFTLPLWLGRIQSFPCVGTW